MIIIEHIPVCQVCAHLTLGRCSAYPGGIPDKIWKLGGHHRDVEPDQEGTDTLLFAFPSDANFVVDTKLMTPAQAASVPVMPSLKDSGQEIRSDRFSDQGLPDYVTIIPPSKS